MFFIFERGNDVDFAFILFNSSNIDIMSALEGTTVGVFNAERFIVAKADFADDFIFSFTHKCTPLRFKPFLNDLSDVTYLR